jgi:hypothetical protein
MGLDTVEFVIAVEEKFGIKIEDAEAVECTTPRKLTDLILSKLEKTDEATCITQRAFHVLRRAFRKVLSVPRGDFRPETPLARLVPAKERRKVWQDIRTEVGAERWPDFVRPQWLVNLLSRNSMTIPASSTIWDSMGEDPRRFWPVRQTTARPCGGAGVLSGQICAK